MQQGSYPNILSSTGYHPYPKFWPIWLTIVVSHQVNRLLHYISPSVNCLFISFTHFPTWFPFLLDLYERYNPSSAIGVVKLFSVPDSPLSFVNDSLTILSSWKAGAILIIQTPFLSQKLVQGRQTLSNIDCTKVWTWTIDTSRHWQSEWVETARGFGN